jgi:hypothetical protein
MSWTMLHHYHLLRVLLPHDQTRKIALTLMTCLFPLYHFYSDHSHGQYQHLPIHLGLDLGNLGGLWEAKVLQHTNPLGTLTTCAFQEPRKGQRGTWALMVVLHLDPDEEGQMEGLVHPQGEESWDLSHWVWNDHCLSSI